MTVIIIIIIIIEFLHLNGTGGGANILERQSIREVSGEVYTNILAE